MPIYEYRCEDCGSDFELLVRQGKEPECPKCSSTKLSKQWSTFAAQGDSTPMSSDAPSSNHGAGCGCCGGGSAGGSCGLN